MLAPYMVTSNRQLELAGKSVILNVRCIRIESDELTVRLRMLAAELDGQSAERLRLARAALCRRAPLKFRSPTGLLQLGTRSPEKGMLFSPLCSVRARLALHSAEAVGAVLPLVCTHDATQILQPM